MKNIVKGLIWAFGVFLALLPIHIGAVKYEEGLLNIEQIFAGVMLEFMVFMFVWFMLYMNDNFFKDN